MSVFSKLRMSKKAAKQHKEKEKQKEEEPAKVPYKHIPTHAAVDALSGAPSTWKQSDRPKIMEHHKRRSQMALSRTGSSLSTVSYMNASYAHSAAGPSTSAPALPRNSSYSSYNPTWFDRTGDVSYTSSSDLAHKRFKPSKGHSYHDSGIGPSPLASNIHSEEVSPVVSSGNSTTSDSSDNLEMRQSAKHLSQRYQQAQQPVVHGEKDIFQHLHSSTTRKVGEAPISTTPVVFNNPMPVTKVVPQKQKQRWSLLGKRNAATLIV